MFSLRKLIFLYSLFHCYVNEIFVLARGTMLELLCLKLLLYDMVKKHNPMINSWDIFLCTIKYKLVHAP